jgi:hypothetical protein
VEVLLGLRLDAADDLQQHADHVVGHFHCPQVNKAGHQRIPNGRRVRSHLARILLVSTALQHAEDFEGYVREHPSRYADRLEPLELGDLLS